MAQNSIDTKEVEERLNDIEVKAYVALKMQMSEMAKQMQNYAQIHRPWTDRTTRARRSLHGVVKEDKAKQTLDVGIAHGVDYGYSLEFEHEKRYAILFPTLQKFTGRIMNAMSRLIEGIGK